MRTDHFAHLLTGLSPVVPGPSPVAGKTEKLGGTRLSPASPVVPGKKHSDREQPSVRETRAGLREALAFACEDLPLTLNELIGAFGDEGESDWRDGYEPHCNDDFLRAFALAVAERLERELSNPLAASPLENLPLLPEDRVFVHKRAGYRDNEDELIAGYREQWVCAAAAEPLSFRQANAGRRAANAWLLDQTTPKRA